MRAAIVEWSLKVLKIAAIVEKRRRGGRFRNGNLCWFHESKQDSSIGQWPPQSHFKPFSHQKCSILKAWQKAYAFCVQEFPHLQMVI